MTENFGELGEDEPEDVSEDMSDDITRSDEYETLRKEVFLALYNLWRISERHEKAVQEHRDAVLRIESMLKGQAPVRAVLPGGVNSSENPGVSLKGTSNIPGWAYAAGGGILFLLLVGVITAIFIGRT